MTRISVQQFTIYQNFHFIPYRLGCRILNSLRMVLYPAQCMVNNCSRQYWHVYSMRCVCSIIKESFVAFPPALQTSLYNKLLFCFRDTQRHGMLPNGNGYIKRKYEELPKQVTAFEFSPVIHPLCP